MKDSFRLQVPSILQKTHLAVLCQRNIPLNKSISGTKQQLSLSGLPKETNSEQRNLFS